MKSYFSGLFYFITERIYHKYSLLFSIAFFFLAFTFSSLHYTKIYYGNSLSWITWVIALGTLFYSFFPRRISFEKILGRVQKQDILIALFVIVLYWVTHLWNFSTAPWNEYGLFDDAAWDIYFAKNHIFTDAPFQAAFFDEVGRISREVVFHYYITFFFKLFGYDLLVFNISLLVLGFITVFFTTFLIQRLFKNNLVTLVSALIINFFPLHYMHIFMGHRYAIIAPLMVISLYFLYSSFEKKSFLRAFLSAFFAALCWGSGVMGKQYILGLGLAALSVLIFGERRWKSKKNIAISLVWIISFIISATPLIAYIVFNYGAYIHRERGFLHEFFSLYKGGGLLAIKPYVVQIIEFFFKKNTPGHQFLPEFHIIPLFYYLLLIPGLWLALKKARFEIVFLSLIPVLAAFVSGPFDFRVLMAVPAWVVGMAFTIEALFKKTSIKIMQTAAKVLSMVVILLGLIPSVDYILDAAKNPNYLYFLSHKDVAVSRMIQDIVVGNFPPSSKMKNHEFRRKVNPGNISYDTLFCPYSAFAIAHLYLQDFNDKQILSFCNQHIQEVKTPDEILEDNLKAIRKYKPQSKDLKLVWEVSDKSEMIIRRFGEYKKYGSEEFKSNSVDGSNFFLYILTIKKENIKSFQEDILAQNSEPDT